MSFWNKKKDDSDSSNAESGSFFNKLGQFFSTEPQKEKVLSHEDFTGAGDTYYATVSAGYKISQRILIILLVIFLVFSLVTNFKEITYDNFFYLIKDFSAATDGELYTNDILSYDSGERHFFTMYRGGLAVVNPSNISVFTATGRRTLKTGSQFSSPCVVSSNKYFLVYDTAGNTFSVYNSFARIYTETLDYPVSGAEFAQDGKMALITRDISHKSMIHIYSKNFKRLYTIPSNRYAFDISLDSEYDKLAVSYYDIGDGSGRTEIDVRKLSDMTEYGQITIDGEFLLDCGFIDNERFAVITDRSVKIYDKYLEELDTYEYDNSTVSGFEVSDHGAAVSYTLNSKNYAIVFDKSGNLLYNENINDNVKDICLFEDFVFLRTDAGIIRINIKNDDEKFLSSGQGKMLIYAADTALVCGDSRAEYIVFED